MSGSNTTRAEIAHALPFGWTVARLGELGRYLNGRGFKKSEWGTVGRPIIRIQDLTGTGETPNYFDGEVEDRHVVRWGDFLISWAATLGAFIWHGVEGVLNQHIFKVESFINRGFHYYAVLNGIEDMYARSRGTGMVHIVKGDFDATMVPLPPLAEQERIADRIDELFTDLSAGVAALERVKRNLSRYRAAVLHAAVTGRLVTSTSVDWTHEAKWKPLGTIIGKIEQGWSPKCEREPASDDSEWAVMTTTAIQPMRFDGYENKRLPEHLEPTPQYEVCLGDMLITRAGPRSRCGITCLVRECRRRLILCDKAYRFRCMDDRAIPEYVELALNARPITDAIERMKTGSSDSGLNLTQTRVRSLRLPVPPKATQSAIVTAVQEKVSQIDALEAEVERGLKRSGRLRQAILKAAFEGKLVPQDPNDEPASALLERVRADAASTNRTSPRTRRRRSSRKAASK
ncbi:MAG: type I restriction enzyme EcoEI specificity protein [Methyloceanibacter sp.]|nr:MAG: type I restriction enzyme EcoEI specificity protein [Methyloceanibacter sp.]